MLLSCYQQNKVCRFIYREGRVTQELQVASFLKSILAEDRNDSEDEELLRNRDLFDHVYHDISRLSDDLRIRLLTTLETESPVLFAHYEDISEEIRVRTRDILAGFTNLEKVDLPPGFALRPKQKLLLPKIQNFFADGIKRTGFIKHPPGMGKTHMIGLMIRALVKHRKVRCLVLSPRDTINAQNEAKIRKMQKEEVTVSNIFRVGVGGQPDVTIANYQHAALESGKDQKDSVFGDYDVIFLDECHRAFGPKVLRLLRTRYPDKIIIGLSATPYLGATSDPKNLRSAFQYFEGQIDDISLKDACNDGDLVPIRAMQVKVKTEQFDENDTTDNKMKKKINKKSRTEIAVDIAQNEIPLGEKGIIFCSGVDHARDTALAIQQAGLKAAHVDHTMSDRDKENVLDAYKAGDLQFIINSDLLIEGFDDPTIKHVIVLRPTQSLWIYEQMIGRGARLDENDPNKVLTVWDVVGQHSQQCTIQGLHEMYIGHKRAYHNGDVLFGVDKLPKAESSHRTDGEKKLGVDGIMEAIIEVEEVGKIVIPRDRAYYENPANVLADLQAFAAAAKLASHEDLRSTHNPTYAICSNKENCSFRSYWQIGCVALGIYETSLDAHMDPSRAIRTFFQKTIGYERVIPETMDSEYFNDQNKIKADLLGFAKVAGVQCPMDLAFAHGLVKTKCSNNEEISFSVYCKRAALVLGFATKPIEALSKFRPTLDKLLEIAGYVNYVKMDAEYFGDLERIRTDLRNFATKAGLPDPNQLTATHRVVGATCSNGEEITFATYLRRAAIALGWAKSSDKFSEYARKTLQKLLVLAAFKTELIISPEEKYFHNAANVKADLLAFAKAANLKDPSDLSSKKGVTAKCTNHEDVLFGTYLDRAGVALGFVKKTHDSKKYHKQIFNKLLVIAGYEPIVYMDAEYFNNKTNVTNDLAAFAESVGLKSAQDLATTHLNFSAKCANGKILTLNGYLCRAAVAFNMAKNTHHAVGFRRPALDRLLKVLLKV